MKEHRASEIDRSNMMLTKLPVSGEDYWVEKPKDYVDPVAVARAEMPQLASTVEGQNRCVHCGQGFNSPNVLNDHVKTSHPIASGHADMSLVEMPDGSKVPVAAVPEIMKQKQDALLAKAQTREAELEAKLEELAGKLAARTIKKGKDK